MNLENITLIDYFEEPESVFEIKRKELLASIISKDYGDTISLLKEVLDTSANCSLLKESEQKSINQTLHMIRKRRKEIPERYQKELQKLTQKLKHSLTGFTKREISHTGFDELTSLCGLTDDRFNILLKNLTSLQITSGCSNTCRRCNEWALPGIRKHLKYGTVIKLANQAFKLGNNEFALYSASDPLDYQDQDKTIADIMLSLTEKGYQPRYGLLTKIPRGSERILETLVEQKTDLAVSITDRNRERSEKVKQKFGDNIAIQHDTDDLLIPAGLDEDFATVKSSITDNYGIEITPEEMFQIIPTYTSALNPTGQYRIPVTKSSRYFIKRKTGRNALAIEYFKPFSVYDEHENKLRLSKLIKPQIENILLCADEEHLSPPGIMNLSEFFKIFEHDALKRRKKIFPVVIKKLYADQTVTKEEFRTKVFNYYFLCNTRKLTEYKLAAISFFLKSVKRYLQIYPAERIIIGNLRKNGSNSSEIPTNPASITDQICSNEKAAYLLFQNYLNTLLLDPEDKIISDFIDTHPSRYNISSDRFELLVHPHMACFKNKLMKR